MGRGQTTLRHLPHVLQLLLLVVIGHLELLHLLRHLVLLGLPALPQLSAPQPGLAVGRQQPQSHELDAGLDGYRKRTALLAGG